VLYCRFLELDRDHDGLITISDLAQHDGGSISRPVLSRVMQGYGKPLTGSKPRTMTFEDYCCEDNTSTTKQLNNQQPNNNDK